MWLVQPQMNDGCHSYYIMFVLLGCRGVCCGLSPVNTGHSTACHPAHTNNRLHENTKLEMLDPPVSQTIVRCKSTFTQLGAFSRMRRFGNIAHRAGGG